MLTKKSRNSASKFTKKTQKRVNSWVDNLFKDNCISNWKGEVIRGPGIWCGLWIVLIILGTVANIFYSWKLTDYNLSKGNIVVQNIIDILISMVQVYFIMRMCYICRGPTALFFVIVFNIVFSALRLKLFSSYSKAIQESMKNRK